MEFLVVDYEESEPRGLKSIAVLFADNWDDWFRFRTTYSLQLFDEKGERKVIGSVKIGQFGMEFEQSTAKIPKNFKSLDKNFFSLGQSETYYEELNKLGDDLRDKILLALNDVAKDPELFKKSLSEDVTGISLLRGVSKSTVFGQFHRLSNGGLKSSAFSFKYKAPVQEDKSFPPLEIDFKVTPDSKPPTNIHVLIGRNGVGKTFMLNAMIRSLVNQSESIEEAGEFTIHNKITDDVFGTAEEADQFSNLVSVSFSAFDSFEPHSEKRNKAEGLPFSYIGLKKKGATKDDVPNAPKSPSALAKEFAFSAKVCAYTSKANRWKRALKVLESDPIFARAEISKLSDITGDVVFNDSASKVFSKLSSGHKIVLLTITRLVEVVEEKTLVLMDEPESHLHPPLLSAFIRSFSDLLMDRNGVAIIATHSPVVLQEVPKSCVWKISRTGGIVKAERPQRETFGENVGILTSEVFGLEVTHSGFHKMLQDEIAEKESYEAVLQEFNYEIGEEAKAIIRSLMHLKNHESEEDATD